VKTARYSLAFCAAVTFEIVYVVDVAPLMFAQVEPPLLESCHCTDGVGLPYAAAVNVAAAPAFTVWLVGLLVTQGAIALVTVRVAALVRADPRVFVKTARYSLALWESVVLEIV